MRQLVVMASFREPVLELVHGTSICINTRQHAVVDAAYARGHSWLVLLSIVATVARQEVFRRNWIVEDSDRGVSATWKLQGYN